ncbi:HNH endonuclease [Bradyrhizobium septentrionale]|uniref:HNH endonuclease n=1 Tax=Bradyrhizobium septentrionale TaxID=1404411 RepID=A0ABZ2P1U6_9BRAD
MPQKIMLCRLVWAEEYKSKKEKIFAGNMSYPPTHEFAVEQLNFADEKGSVFGFVENRGQNVKLENLGANPADESIDGVTIVFCAVDKLSMNLRVVGWYENAIVFRELQPAKKGSIRGDWEYYFQASSVDAHLVPATERDLEVPRKTRRIDRGFIGQRNIFYPAGNPNYERFLQNFDLVRRGAQPNGTGETDQTAFQEGQRASREASYFARNAGLVKAAKHHHGTTCQGCGFNFADVYGDIGEDYVEVHHKRPIAGGEVRVSTVHDVDVLCANCHRMVHRREIPLTLKELRALIASQRARRKRA